MSAIASTQARALIARLNDEVNRAAAEMRTTTDAECKTIEREARRLVRAKLRAAFVEKRRRIAERGLAVEIECEAMRRAAAFAEAARFAELAIAALPEALIALWQQPPARQDWCAAALAIGARILVNREWIVELAAGAGAPERDLLAHGATAAGALVREFRDSRRRCGLRIGQGMTWVDATGDGLLADRGRLVAELLAEVAQVQPSS